MKLERGADPGPFSKLACYKPHLRSLFRCRCAYCLTPDDRLGGEEAMTIDHFKPVTRHKDLKLAWPNLYYACPVCNSHYKKDFPSPEEETGGKRFVDPCLEDPDDHFRLIPDPDTGDLCRVRPLSAFADYTVHRLKFNQRKFLRDFWRGIHQEERRCLKRVREIRLYLKRCAELAQGNGESGELSSIQTEYRNQLSCVLKDLKDARQLRPFPFALM